MDNATLNSFKQEIECMFEKSFQELSQKNNLNKAILSNLMDAASAQSQRINQLDSNIQTMKKSSTPNLSTIKNEVNSQQKIIHDNFDAMMYRLSQIEQGIGEAHRTAENNNKINRESEQSLNELLKQMERIEKEEGIPEYHGNRDQLLREVEEFERMLDEETDKVKGVKENLGMSSKTVAQPLQTFQTKMALHTKNNEQILKEKLRCFSEKIRGIEKKVEESQWRMSNEMSQAKGQQSKLIEEMNNAEREMLKMREELEMTDQRRKQEIQSSAMSLDNLVEEMLVETKKLEVRVDGLRRGYEMEADKYSMKKK